MKSFLKKKENFGTANPYLEAKETMDRNLIKELNEALNDFFLKKPKTRGDVFKIQQCVQM